MKVQVIIVMVMGVCFSFSAGAQSSFKGGVGISQYFINKRDSKPVAANFFLGERFEQFGDVGVYGNYLFPAAGLSSYKSLGLEISPAFFREAWGSLLWANRVGFGNFEGHGHVHLATGLRLEPGTFFQLGLEILRPVPIRSDSTSAYPSAVGITLGIHLR